MNYRMRMMQYKIQLRHQEKNPSKIQWMNLKKNLFKLMAEEPFEEPVDP